MLLHLFDVDGTLIRSFLREGASRAHFDLIEVLPFRKRTLDHLKRDGHRIALVSNQGGVALGYQTKRQVCRKLTNVALELGLPLGPIRVRPNALVDSTGYPVLKQEPLRDRPVVAYVSLGLPQATVPEYQVLEIDGWRKPGAGMLHVAMLDHDVEPHETTFIGDMDSDREAAEAAGVRYCDAEEFFA